MTTYTFQKFAFEVRTLSMMEFDPPWIHWQKKRAENRAYWARMAPMTAQAQMNASQGLAAQGYLGSMFHGLIGNIGREPYEKEKLT